MHYFTSDLHLGHGKVLYFNNRPFESLEEMNEILINNINETVGADDDLWVLGDFAFRIGRTRALEFRSKIRCKKVHLILGNHDLDYSDTDAFVSIDQQVVLGTQYGTVVLCHYPFLEWHKAHYGSIHLHGHIHSTGEYNERNLQLYYRDRFPEGHTPKNPELKLRVYDVGVDANNYRPISLDEIADKMGIVPLQQ